MRSWYPQPSSGENYPVKLYKKKPNSPYEYEEAPYCIFRGRPAGSLERKSYRLTKGVNTSSDAIYLIATNLPDEVSDGDRAEFQGKIWTVQSVGYYYDDNGIVDASIMDPKYIESRCPKGVSLG